MAGTQEASATDPRRTAPASIDPTPQADDWTHIEDPRVKKRVQNRVAQRLYRQRQKARIEELEAKFRLHEEQSTASDPSSRVTDSTETTTLLTKFSLNSTKQCRSPGRTRSRQQSMQTIGPPDRKGTSNGLQADLSESASGSKVSRRGSSFSDSQNYTPGDLYHGASTPRGVTSQMPVSPMELPHSHAGKVLPNQVHSGNAVGVSNPVDFANFQVDAVGGLHQDGALDLLDSSWSNDFDCAGVSSTPAIINNSWKGTLHPRADSIPPLRTEHRSTYLKDSFEYQQQTPYPSSAEATNSIRRSPVHPPGREASKQERINYVMDCARLVGFEDFDTVAETYYNARFSDVSDLNGVQKISRNRYLPQVLAALRHAAQNWTAWERRGLNQEMVIGAEGILVEECDSSSSLKQFNDWFSTGASPDFKNQATPVMMRGLQDELPNMWALMMTLCSENPALRPQDRPRVASLVISMMYSDPYGSN